MNKEQILAIIQGGHTTDGDLADALLAELAKQSEPFGYYENGRWSIVTDGGPDKWRSRKEYTGPLYTNLLPQPDLVAEIERLKSRLEFDDRHGWDGIECRDETIKGQDKAITELRQQLSAAQASESELLKALEKIDEDAKDTCLSSVRHLGRIANGAITAHKSRKEK